MRTLIGHGPWQTLCFLSLRRHSKSRLLFVTGLFCLYLGLQPVSAAERSRGLDDEDLLRQTKIAEQLLNKKQAPQAEQVLASKLQAYPNHFLKPYWLYLAARLPQFDATRYIQSSEGLLPYYYWWKSLALPAGKSCHPYLSYFAKTLAQAPEDPIVQDTQALVAQLHCMQSTLTEPQRLTLAEFFSKQKIYSLAAKVLENTQTPQGTYLRGTALQEQGRYQEAYLSFTRTIQLAGQAGGQADYKKKAIVAAGKMQHELKNDAAAFKWWAAITPQDQQYYPEILWQKALILLQKDRDTEALGPLRQLYSSYPQSPFALDALWYLLRQAIQKTNYAQIIPLADRMVQSSQPHEYRSAAQYWLAKGLQLQGDNNRAIRLLENLSEGPLNDYYTHMATCRLKNTNCYQMVDRALNFSAPRPAFLTQAPPLQWLSTHNEYAMLQTIAPFQHLSAFDRELLKSYLLLQKGDYFYSIRSIWKNKTRNTEVLKLMYPLHYLAEVEKNAKRFQLPVGFIAGLIWQESMYKADIRSHSGAIGLMQLMPATAAFVAQKMGKRGFYTGQLVQPPVNIEMGSFYLRQQLNTFGNNPIFTLAAYNGGPTSVSRWRKQFGHLEPDAFIEQITFAETRRYVKQVLTHYWVYNSIYG